MARTKGHCHILPCRDCTSSPRPKSICYVKWGSSPLLILPKSHRSIGGNANKSLFMSKIPTQAPTEVGHGNKSDTPQADRSATDGPVSGEHEPSRWNTHWQ